MKMIISESQYNTLIRRLDDFAVIDRQFKYQLRKKLPCNFTHFEDYFNFVSYRTEDYVTNKLIENNIIKFEFELSIKIRREIENYIKDNFSEYAKEYYDYYKEKNCPEE
jgi:siroheme synthase (precorrin-2 oxidase/ferrochelatase)